MQEKRGLFSALRHFSLEMKSWKKRSSLFSMNGRGDTKKRGSSKRGGGEGWTSALKLLGKKKYYLHEGT